MPWLIYSKFAVALVLFYSWIPFVALPMFAVLENMDRRCSRPPRTWARAGSPRSGGVTLPLSLPGVIAGFVFVLIPTTGEFIAPLSSAARTSQRSATPSSRSSPTHPTGTTGRSSQ